MTQNVKDQERRDMSNDNTQDGAEPSPASVGSHGADITVRLRRWSHSVDAVPASDLMDEAADEIESLKAEVKSMLEVCRFERETSERYASFLRLTDEERKAVAAAIKSLLDDPYDGAPISPDAATLRNLLDRMK
jgi:hypothetical protein